MAQAQNTAHRVSQQVGQKALLLLCLLVPLVMHTETFNFALLPKRFVVQIALTIIACAWVWDLRNNRVPIYTSSFYLPLVCYLVLSLVATTQAVNPTSAIAALSHQITFLLLFVLVAHTFPIEALTTFFRISTGVGIFVSFIGIFEARGVEGWLPLSNGRPSATFAYRNFAAAFLILNIPLAVTLTLKARNSIDAYLGLFSTTMMLVFLIYTRTRGAWIGLSCAMIITTIIILLTKQTTTFSLSKTLHNRTLQIAAGLCFAFAIILATLPPNIASQQSRAIDDKKVQLLDALSFATTPEADRGRTAMWQHTIEIIQDHSFLGIGPGNWKHIYPLYDGGDLLRKDSAPERPHNDYLEIASETGTVSLLVYGWFLCTIAIVLLRILKNPSHPDHTLFALAFATGMLAMLGHGMVSFPNERIPTSFLFWFGLGILTQLDPRRSPYTIPQPVVQKALLLIPLLLACTTYISHKNIQFDRHYLKAFDEYYRGGDMRSVLHASTTALEQGAFDSQAYLLQGQGYQAARQHKNAENAYQKGLVTSPHSVSLIGALGHVYAQTGRYDEAEKLFQQVLRLSPSYIEMHNNLGGIYQSRGDLHSAISAYKKVLAITPNAIETLSNLGLAYVAVDSTLAGIRTHEAALRLSPNSPAFYYNLGEAYYQHAQKDPDVLPFAHKAFERFIQYWKGPASDTQKARQRLIDIQGRLAQ